MTAEEIVRAVIRADAPMSALRSAGLTVRSQPDWSVVPDLGDIGRGLVYYSHRRGGKRWAALLIHAAFIDLRPAPNNPEWDSLMGAIWDLSSGIAVSPEVAEVARRVSTGKISDF